MLLKEIESIDLVLQALASMDTTAFEESCSNFALKSSPFMLLTLTFSSRIEPGNLGIVHKPLPGHSTPVTMKPSLLQSSFSYSLEKRWRAALGVAVVCWDVGQTEGDGTEIILPWSVNPWIEKFNTFQECRDAGDSSLPDARWKILVADHYKSLSQLFLQFADPRSVPFFQLQSLYNHALRAGAPQQEAQQTLANLLNASTAFSASQSTENYTKCLRAFEGGLMLNNKYFQKKGKRMAVQ
jgi:hypothetical protein